MRRVFELRFNFGRKLELTIVVFLGVQLLLQANDRAYLVHLLKFLFLF